MIGSYFSVQKMSPAVHILNSQGSRGDLNLLRAQCFLINYRISLFLTDLASSFISYVHVVDALSVYLNPWAYNC